MVSKSRFKITKDLMAAVSLVVEHTGRIVVIGKVRPICRARNIDTPKRASNAAFLQTREIHMTRKGSMDEGFGEVGGVNVVLEQYSNLDGEIIMTV